MKRALLVALLLLCGWMAVAQVVTAPMPYPRQQFLDSNGDPLAGGKLYSYAAGTTSPIPTYKDATGSAMNTNPVILDAGGQASVWLSSASYKLVLTDAAGVLQWTADNIVVPHGTPLSYRGTWSETTQYTTGDMVTYSGSLYISLVQINLGNQPDTSATQWSILGYNGVSSDGTNGIVVQGMVQARTVVVGDGGLGGGNQTVTPMSFQLFPDGSAKFMGNLTSYGDLLVLPGLTTTNLSTLGGSTLLAYGDSITYGVGATSCVAGDTPSGTCFASLFAAHKGWSLSNYASSGSVLADSVQQDALVAQWAIQPNTPYNYLLMTGRNDEVMANTNQVYQKQYQDALFALTAIPLLPITNKISGTSMESGSPLCTFSTNWTVEASMYGGNMVRSTTTNDDPITCNAPGRTLYAVAVLSSPNDSTYEWLVDGVVQPCDPELESQSLCSAGVYKSLMSQVAPLSHRSYIPRMHRFTGLTNALHTVALKKVSGTGKVYLLYIGVPDGVTARNTSTLYLANCIRSSSTGYATGGTDIDGNPVAGIGSDLGVQQYNDRIKTVATTLAKDGLNIELADVEPVVIPEANMLPDGIHPGDIGHAAIAKVLENESDGFMNLRDRTALKGAIVSESTVVHTTGNETIAGTKTFADGIVAATVNGDFPKAIKTIRGVSGCTTPGTAGTYCASPVTLTWPTSFADTNYAVTCSGTGTTGAPGPFVINSKSTTTVTVNYAAISNSAASYVTIDCIGVHD